MGWRRRKTKKAACAPLLEALMSVLAELVWECAHPIELPSVACEEIAPLL